jgi:hypothetical protein
MTQPKLINKNDKPAISFHKNPKLRNKAKEY